MSRPKSVELRLHRFLEPLDLCRSRTRDDEIIDVHADEEPSAIACPVLDGVLVLALLEAQLPQSTVQFSHCGA